MKKVVLMLFLGLTFAGAKSVYLPCNSRVNTQSHSAQQALKAEFERTKAELELLKTAYSKKLESLKEANLSLMQQLELKKEETKDSLELIFLLRKNNELLGNLNSIEAIE